MEVKTLLAEYHINHPEEFRCRFVSSVSEREILHNHDYYELFFTKSDDIIHHINGTRQILPKGSLVLIRPTDEHLYMHDEKHYSFINISFTTKMFEDVITYLGDTVPKDYFTHSKLPPKALLSASEQKNLKGMLNQINTLKYDSPMQKKRYLKYLLVAILSQYFQFDENIDSDFVADKNLIPQWLIDTCSQMRSMENAFEGIPAMVRISDRSYEHLSRSMKKYYNKTLSEFITEERINIAANLLENSDMPITGIYSACGFNNASYFNKKFKDKFGITPYQYRNSN